MIIWNTNTQESDLAKEQLYELIADTMKEMEDNEETKYSVS